MKNSTLAQAINGDIKAYQELFLAFQPQLRSYLYRLVANRTDAEDLAQDTFVRSFEKIGSFRADATLKTWVFKIATNLATDHLRRQKRWSEDAQDKAKAYAQGDEATQRTFWMAHTTTPDGKYEVKEHIDFCFTCIGKSLAIEQQVALILKDIYRFSIKEISAIMGKTNGIAKHLLLDARKTMQEIFQRRCALINKNGTCHQCTELAGIYNPRQSRRVALMELDMVAGSDKFDREELYQLRAKLVSAIDPLNAAGSSLHEEIMACVRKVA